MMLAVIYARVSSRDQEREGFSIPAQLKLLREYAQSHNFQVVQEFVDIETAKTTGRKQFGEMLRFLGRRKDCRVVLVEKTDRLYRNFKDYVTPEDLDVEIHLPKEGQIISKNAKSQAKLAHGLHLVMARNYIENLREEVIKGMRQKAEQGFYPGRPPFGYRNNKVQRTIELDPQNAPTVKRMFDLYATGEYTLKALREASVAECGFSTGKANLERLLKNPFYIGSFIWQDTLYKGVHPPLISAEQFEQVQDVIHGRSKRKQHKHHFAFAGLMKCAYDNCAVTAEFKKGKYTYYRCTGHRGKCDLPYFREEEIGDRLGRILQDIRIPDEVLTQIKNGLAADTKRQAEMDRLERQRLEQRLASVRRRIDQAYLDKLDGNITEDFWVRKSTEWQAEEQRITRAIQALAVPKPERLMDTARILELANKAYSLYVSQSPAERAKLLKMVLSNCSVDAVSVYPTYRKPFDLIFKRVKTGEWSAIGVLRSGSIAGRCDQSRFG